MLLDPKWMRYSAAMSSAVIMKALLIYGGYLLGSWLDKRWGTEPFLMVLGLSLGAGVGIWWILIVAERAKPR